MQILVLFGLALGAGSLASAQTIVDEVDDLHSMTEFLQPMSGCRNPEQSASPPDFDLTQNTCAIIDPEKDPTINSPMHRFSSIAKRVSKVPGPLGRYLERLIQDYSEVLQLQAYYSDKVGMGNSGLSKYILNHFQSDPQLLKTAHGFYAEIARIDSEKPQHVRPSIGKAVSPEESGWLWKLALKHTKQDSLQAMRLIGLCGHDDVNRGEEVLKGASFSEEEKKALFKNKLIEVESTIDFLTRRKEDIQRDKEPQSLLDSLEAELNFQQSELQKMKTFGPGMLSGSHPFKCPQNYSKFFTPGSLGVDISESTKERVMRDQNEHVAAKYYHVIGAALVSCELVARGHSADLIAGFQKLLGWTYRTQRFNTEVCALARRDFDAKPEELTEASRIKRDAAELMQRWAFNTDGSMIGKKLKTPFQTNFRVVIPEWLEQAPLIGKAIDKISRPAGWSDERYRKARAKFESYMTDWQWTTEAHEVGGQFGARVCSQLNANHK